MPRSTRYAETPIWVPPEKLRARLGEVGFGEVQELAAGTGVAILAARDARGPQGELHEGVGGEFGFDEAREAFCAGAAYLNATGWGPAGYGYPAGAYGWHTASDRSYPSSGSAGYLYYPAGSSYGYGSGAPASGSSGYGTVSNTGGLYYAPPLLCGYGGAC